MLDDLRVRVSRVCACPLAMNLLLPFSRVYFVVCVLFMSCRIVGCGCLPP